MDLPEVQEEALLGHEQAQVHLESEPEQEELSIAQVSKVKALLEALSLISRDVPLSAPLLHAVAAIEEQARDGILLQDFRDAVASQRSEFASASALKREQESRIHRRLARRIKELQGYCCLSPGICFVLVPSGTRLVGVLRSSLLNEHLALC